MRNTALAPRHGTVPKWRIGKGDARSSGCTAVLGGDTRIICPQAGPITKAPDNEGTMMRAFWLRGPLWLRGSLAGLVAALIAFSAEAQQASPPPYPVPPQYAAPQYAPPQYAAPNYPPPNYAPPQYAAPNYAAPPYGGPQYGGPQNIAPKPAAPKYAAPRAVVERLQKAITDVLKHSKKLGFSGRYDKLDPIIRSSFNLPFMAKTAAGTHWSGASAEARRHFVEAFSRMTTAIYAMRFDDNDGEFFAIMGEEQSGERSALVRTEMRKPDGNHVAVNYLLREIGGPWKIVDVYAMGRVSELAARESNYDGILKTESLDDLAATMDAEVTKMRRRDELLRRAQSLSDSESADRN